MSQYYLVPASSLGSSYLGSSYSGASSLGASSDAMSSLNTLPSAAAGLQDQYDEQYANLAAEANNPEYTGVSTNEEDEALESVGLNPAAYGLSSSTSDSAQSLMSLSDGDGYIGGVSDSYLDSLLGVSSGTSPLSYGMTQALADPDSAASQEVESYEQLGQSPTASEGYSEYGAEEPYEYEEVAANPYGESESSPYGGVTYSEESLPSLTSEALSADPIASESEYTSDPYASYGVIEEPYAADEETLSPVMSEADPYASEVSSPYVSTGIMPTSTASYTSDPYAEEALGYSTTGVQSALPDPFVSSSLSQYPTYSTLSAVPQQAQSTSTSTSSNMTGMMGMMMAVLASVLESSSSSRSGSLTV